MNPYDIALFVHMMGIISLFGAFILLQNVGSRLRSAATWPEVRTFMSVLRVLPRMFPAAFLMLMASGLYMTQKQWSFGTPWVVVGMTLAIVMAIVGTLFVGRRLEAIGREAAKRVDAVSEADGKRLAAPALWGPLFANNGAGLGIVWIMSTKPD